MLIVLSPAKSLDYESPVDAPEHTLPEFIDHSAELISGLRQLSPSDIASLMKISDPLAALNAGRYASWTPQFNSDNARAAVLAFNGDVYAGLEAATLPATAMAHLQSHVRILSGLYGVLRPLDLMQPYRLEMGTRLKTSRGASLYAFWGDLVSRALDRELRDRQSAAMINLASEEYFKVVQPALLSVPVITPVFQDWKDGRYKIISFYAKKARGLMARYAAINAITDPEQLKGFDLDGYAYDAAASGRSAWYFRRG
ncbi:MAG: peroxide stress protein YaaA [Burkholderiaceae bacterium]